MIPTSLLVTLGVLGGVLWIGRRIPLAGSRKRVVIGCRAAAVLALCAALWGLPARRSHDAPRHLIYLADGSASIDERQQAWIARRIASLESLRPAQVERALVVFGGDSQTLVPFGREPMTDPEAIRRALAGAAIRRERTNLEAAMLSTFSLLPPERSGRVILLSDGQETEGHVTGIAASLARLGLEVFPASPPPSGENSAVWEELAVPPVVQRGSPVAIQLVVFNGASKAKAGHVTVALHHVPIKRQPVVVPPGWQVVRTSVPAIQPGTMPLEVELSIPDDGLTERRMAYTEVEGPPRLLLVSDRAKSLPALATALKRRDIDIALMRPSDLPADANQLMDSDGILLFNLPKSAFSPEQVEALRTYVETLGGGLVMVGLGGDLADELQHPAPLDALLPVQFEPKGLQESKRRVCMILLIDRSASMLGPRIAATKRAAVELVKQLAPEDLVGILAFDTEPYVIAEVHPAGQVGQSLVEKLVQLRSSGGTDVYPALTAAANRLELTGATLKHIILLSDGNTPFHEQAYHALIEAFKLSGTTVSTIGIGSAFVNTDYLDWLATSTGGEFYQMRKTDELPRLVAKDTQDALERLPFAEGYFRPSRTPASEWFPDTADWPVLRGYFTASAKPSARVELTVSGGAGEEPLLARWALGQGRVAVFTSDADTRWSPEWIRWPGFEGTWAQIVRWAMRPRLTQEVFVWVDENQISPRLVIVGDLHDPKATLIAAEGSAAQPLSLIQTGTWRWHASLEQVPSGWHQLRLESQAAAETGSGTVFAKRWIQLGTPPAIQEASGQPPREKLLRQLAQSTAGVYEAPDGAFLPPTTSATTATPPLTWWLPLAILALLLDIALRGASML